MARRGKVARLPVEVRTELNRRLRNGELGESLVKWLNGLEATQKTLAEHFDGKPISEQNLSLWRLGGYQDWAREEELRGMAEQLVKDEGTELDSAAEGEMMGRIATCLATRMACVMQSTLTKDDPKAEWKLLQQASRTFRGLHKADLSANWLALARTREDRRAVKKRTLLKAGRSRQASPEGGEPESQSKLIKVNHG